MTLPQTHELLNTFRAFLSESGLSKVSVKNYVSDVRKFLEFDNSLPSPSAITKFVAALQDSQVPHSTINRYLASLRRYSVFLKVKYEIDAEGRDQSTENKETSLNSDPCSLISATFLKSLQNEDLSHSTIKNYKSDLNHFWAWIASNPSQPAQNAQLLAGETSDLSHILSPSSIDKYQDHLKIDQTSSSVINRRISTLKKFVKFALTNKLISEDPFQRSEIRDQRSGNPLAFFKRHSRVGGNLFKNNSLLKNLKLKIENYGLYRKYNALPFVPYLHLAILVLFVALLANFGYDQIVTKAVKSQAYPASPTRPTRQLSFQGRLTDSSDTPITVATDVVFKLYNALSGGSQLYTSGTCSVTPDQDGIFNTLIGDTTCGAEIDSSVFSENQSVYMEVTVGASTLTPRQQIATVGYALNTETLQGYPVSSTASATRSTVAVMNQFGEVILGEQSPVLKSVSGTFNLQGQTLSLSTASTTNGNINLSPDGTGSINAVGGATSGNFLRITDANLTSGNLISGYVGNNTATGNLLSLSSGSSETTRLAVGAFGQTTLDAAGKGKSALIVNQIDSGPIFAASASGTNRFLITNAGNITLNQATIIDSTGTLSLNTTNNQALTTGTGVTTLGGNLVLNNSASTTTFGGIAYTWPTSGQSSNYVLATNGTGTLSWNDASLLAGSVVYWNQTNGSLFPKNSTVDAFIGGQATASAKFAFLNVNSGTPTASISGTANRSLVLDAFGNITTTAKQSLTLGDSSTGNIILNAGNVGVGTTAPLQTLHIAGQCVTGDTLLKRRKRRKDRSRNKFGMTGGPDPDEDWEWEDVRIDEIEAGDEILTLDEKTGKFITSKVNGLMDMGVKSVYKLTTEDGKNIRTTGNHPYLVRQKGLPADQSNPGFSQDRQFTSQISIGLNSRQENKNYFNNFAFTHLSNQDNDHPLAFTDTETENITKTPIKSQQDSLLLTSKVVDSLIIGTDKSSLLNSQNVNAILAQTQGDVSVNTFIYQELEDHSLNSSNFQNFLFSQNATGISESNFSISDRDAVVLSGNIRKTISPLQKIQDVSDGDPSTLDTGFTKSDGLFNDDSGGNSGLGKIIHESNYSDLTDKMSNSDWTKVIYLKVGDEIAVADGDRLNWSKIASIKYVGQEQVYDIEVENTHNFVGNGIVAHNTYINSTANSASIKGLEIAQSGAVTGTGYGLYAAKTGASTTNVGGYFSASGATNNYAAIFESGNVGIGTTAPTFRLDVYGSNSGAWETRIRNTHATTGYGLLVSAGNDATNKIAEFRDVNDAAKVTILGSGNVGIGTTGPGAKLESLSTTEQLRLSYSGGVYSSFTVSSVGDLNYTTAGGGDEFDFWNGVAGARYVDIGQNGSTEKQFRIFDSGTANTLLSSTGNSYLNATAGNVGIGTTSPAAKLDVSGSASVSGNLNLYAATPTIQAVLNQNLVLGGNTTGSINFGSNVGTNLNPKVTSTYDLGTSSLIWNNLYVNNIYAPGTGISGYWQRNSGAVSPANLTDDLLLGATATSSAKFAFKNIASGTPTASISGNSAGRALSIDGLGNITTTAKQSLTLGDSSTGNIILNAGNVGIGTTAPGAKLDVSGNIRIGAGSANSILSLLDANSSNYYRTIYDQGSRLYFENTESGGGFYFNGNSGGTDYFETANIDIFNINSGQFYLAQSSGNIGIGTTAPLAKLELSTGNIAAASAGFATGAPTLVSRFDGPKPDETDFTGNPNGNLGQAATVTGGVIHRPGKFGKGVQIAEATTNLYLNPSFETNTSNWNFVGDGTGATFVQSSTYNYYGSYSAKLTIGTGGTYAQTWSPNLDTNTQSYTNSWYFRKPDGSAVTNSDVQAVYNGSVYNWGTITSVGNGWYLATVSYTAGATSYPGFRMFGSAGTVLYADGGQQENKAYRTPYADGSLGNGHSWSGTAHASTSSRTAAGLTYPLLGNAYNNAGTISFWFYANSYTSAPALVDLSNSVVNGLRFFNYGFDRVGDVTISNVWSSSDLNTWIHIVGTWDGTALKAYKNGVLIGSVTMATTPTLVSPIDLLRVNQEDQYRTNGQIDDLAIFPSALSAQEIYSIYKSNAPLQTEDQSSVLTAGKILPVSGATNIAGNFIPTATNTYDLGSSSIQWNNLYVNNIISGGTTAGFWQRNSGAMAPSNLTDDLLLGTTATSSAKFAFKNIASGTPTATISGNSAGRALSIDGLGNITTTAKQSLTLGDSSTGNIILNAGNVGIGTTGPSRVLHTLGAVRISRNDAVGQYIEISGGDSAISSGSKQVMSSDDNLSLGIGTTKFIQMSASGNVTYFNTGNVGIGTTNPLTKFHTVGSDAAAIGLIAGATKAVRLGATSTYAQIEGVDNTGTATYQPLYVGGSTLDFTISGSRKVSIDTSGNVGIGTTAPTAKLQVKGDATYGSISLDPNYSTYGPRIVTTAGSSAGHLYLAPVSGLVSLYDGALAFTQYIYNAGAIGVQLSSNGVSYFNGGNVGIGTTGPLTKLHVLGSSATNVDVLTLENSDITSNVTRSVTQNFVGNDTVGNKKTIASIWARVDQINANDGSLHFGTRNANTFYSDRMAIDTSGNVGIGTTGPGAILDVSKSDTTTYSSVPSGIYEYSPYPHELVIRNTASGGTNSFTGIFFDAGDTTDGLQINAARITAIRNGGFATDLAFGTRNSAGTSAERVRIDSTGNVGIGTTGPVAPLEIQGANVATDNGVAAGGLFVSTNNAQATNLGGHISLGGRATDSLANTYAFANIAGRKENSTSANYAGYLALATNNSVGTMSEAMRITSGGNVGIGTTSPASDVAWASPGLDISGTRGAAILRTTGATGIATLRMTGPGASYVDDWHINMYAGANSYLAFYPKAGGGNTGLVLKNDGNVGIGTTGPNAKLQVAGNVNIYDPGGSDRLLYISQAGGSTTVQLNSNGVSYINSGNVGIGTTSPGEKLSVNGIGIFGGVTSHTTLYTNFDSQTSNVLEVGGSTLQTTNAGWGNVTMSNNQTGTSNIVGGIGFANSATGGTEKRLAFISGWTDGAVNSGLLQFQVNNAGTVGTAMTIKSSGNVGIGTTAPSQKLHLSNGVFRIAGGGANSNGEINLDNGTEYNGLQIRKTLSTAWEVKSVTSGNALFLAVDNGIDGGGSGVYIKSGGNVGIGTTGPTAKLHVVGNCVTGDTLLPIKRRKKRSRNKFGMTGGPDPDEDMDSRLRGNDGEDGNDDYDSVDDFDEFLCPIRDIQPEDQVLSLNEATGTLEYSKINKLMDMGIKQVFELTTKSGRVIRTTAAHPYLTLLSA